MSSPLAVHLLRHGAATLSGRLIGRTDCPATPEGIAAGRAAVAGVDFSAIYSSDLARARDCAGAIAADRGLAVTTDPRWRELDFGAWDGLHPAEIDSSALNRFWADPEACPPPGGERWSALVKRVDAALAALDPAAGTPLIVTHAGAMRALVAGLCGLDARQAWSVALPHAALLSLAVWRHPAPSAQITGLKTLTGSWT